ncbi:S-adenosyl methyltransferase [Prauserella aidingensis]|uniref:SAM-dependent methyltransferase n=1 Tax=Prauserella aidingensis TaxID=387890 RepID=UPI0020A5C08E|nr:SAM-dependent methyltransferase [Prauserella aidingensis]MCP2252741.1 S-adenosyl methyltransferase [Prauserella aidingensis]
MTAGGSEAGKFAGKDLELDKPNPARMYDYVLGGELNYAIDRQFVSEILATMPRARDTALLNRYWLRRAVRYGTQQGIRQFLDLGSGMPTVGQVHEIAQGVDPAARVVYVDNERVAVAHSEIVLDGNDRAEMIGADAERVDEVLGHPTTRRLLDFGQPVMVLMSALVHCFSPVDRNPATMISRYRNVLASGSYLALSSFTTEQQGDDIVRAAELSKDTSEPIHPRSRDEIRGLMAGFELVDPGIVFTPEWHPESPEDVGEEPELSGVLAAVGYKP